MTPIMTSLSIRGQFGRRDVDGRGDDEAFVLVQGHRFMNSLHVYEGTPPPSSAIVSFCSCFDEIGHFYILCGCVRRGLREGGSFARTASGKLCIFSRRDFGEDFNPDDARANFITFVSPTCTYTSLRKCHGLLTPRIHVSFWDDTRVRELRIVQQ